MTRPTVAVILAAGRGSRMQAATNVRGADAAQRAMAASGYKTLIPFGGRPFLSWVLDAVADAGYDAAAVVVRPGSESTVAQALGAAPLTVECVSQDVPLGTADAVLRAEPVVGGRSFIVINGDNWYPSEALHLLREHDAPATVGFSPADRVEAFALMATDDEGCLVEIVEKPDRPSRDRLGSGALVSMTCWSFGPEALDACRNVAPSARGELELPDAVRTMVARGARVAVLPHPGPVLDLSHPADIQRMGAQLRAGAGR